MHVCFSSKTVLKKSMIVQRIKFHTAYCYFGSFFFRSVENWVNSRYSYFKSFTYSQHFTTNNTQTHTNNQSPRGNEMLLIHTKNYSQTQFSVLSEHEFIVQY